MVRKGTEKPIASTMAGPICCLPSAFTSSKEMLTQNSNLKKSTPDIDYDAWHREANGSHYAWAYFLACICLNILKSTVN